MTDNNLNSPIALAEQLLGCSPDRIEPFNPPSGGLESQSLRLWRGSDALFMKLNREQRMPLGIYFHKRLRQAGLPVPELVAWHPSLGPEKRSCAIWEYIDGDQANWLKLKVCPYDEEHCGELLRRVHALDYEGPFCFLGDEGCNPYFSPCVDSWSDMFPVAKEAQRYFNQGRLNRRQADLLASLPEQLASELGRVEKRLLHMDFLYNGNLVIERGGKRIIAIVDGAESMSGDPRLELAYFDFGYQGSGWKFDMERFRAGYGTEHDPQDPLRRFYQLNYYLFERFDHYYANGDRGARYQKEIKALLDTFA